MRIVSQDGMVDVPYELVGLSISSMEAINDYRVMCDSRAIDDNSQIMARYTSKAKAIKAMKMVLEAYNKRKLMEMTYSKGVLVELCKSIGESELAIACSSVFQFPKDDEIEV